MTAATSRQRWRDVAVQFVTVTRVVPILPSMVAEMVTTPACRPVTSPVSFTVAM